MSTETVASGAHVALLKVIEGAGILVAPPASADVWLDGPESLHAADWTSMVGRLARAGWTFLADEWDLPVLLASMPDGRRVYGLYPALVDAWDRAPSSIENGEFSETLRALIDEFVAVA